jgi:hypothetical protein
MKYQSGEVAGGGKLLDCVLCSLLIRPVFTNLTFRIIHCTQCNDYICTSRGHFDQQINFDPMVYVAKKIGERLFKRFSLDFSNYEFDDKSHLYLHIRRTIFI